MNFHNDAPENLAEWCRQMETQLRPVVRRALSQAGQRLYDPTGLTARIVAAAERLAVCEPALAARGREGLVRPVARQIAEALARRSPQEQLIASGAMETVLM